MRTIQSADIPRDDTPSEFVKREFPNGAFIRTTYASESRANVRASANQNGFKVVGWYLTSYGGFYCAIVTPKH